VLQLRSSFGAWSGAVAAPEHALQQALKLRSLELAAALQQNAYLGKKNEHCDF